MRHMNVIRRMTFCAFFLSRILDPISRIRDTVQQYKRGGKIKQCCGSGIREAQNIPVRARIRICNTGFIKKNSY
jgi:hypothetical protein